MNLHAIVSSAVASVNPHIWVSWIQASGTTTDAAFHRTASTTTRNVQAQVQGLSGDDLKHMDGLNVQGVMRSVFMYGNVQGVVRADQKGGDILQFPEVPGGTVKNWRIVKVMETWPDWSRVVVVLQ